MALSVSGVGGGGGLSRPAPPWMNTDSTLSACVCAPRWELPCQKYTHTVTSRAAPPKVQWSAPPACPLNACTATPAAAQSTRTAGGLEGWLGLQQPSTTVLTEKKEKKFCRGIAVMSGQPSFVNPFPRPRCLAAAAAEGKAKLTHPGKAILAGKKVCAWGGWDVQEAAVSNFCRSFSAEPVCTDVITGLLSTITPTWHAYERKCAVQAGESGLHAVHHDGLICRPRRDSKEVFKCMFLLLIWVKTGSGISCTAAPDLWMNISKINSLFLCVVIGSYCFKQEEEVTIMWHRCLGCITVKHVLNYIMCV